MSITCLCIGDQHFSDGNGLITDKLTDLVIENIRRLNPTFTVLMGDIQDKMGNSYLTTYDRSIKFLQAVHDSSNYTYMLIGNHDRLNNKIYLGDSHFYNSVKKWPKITVVDEVITRKHGNVEFGFVPYVEDGRFEETIEGIQDKSSLSAIFAHQMFSVCSPTGDVIDNKWPIIISGHIHDYSRHDDKLIYVGSPYQISFAESSDKSISLFSFENDLTWKEERIKLTITNKQNIHISLKDFWEYEVPIEMQNNQTRISVCLNYTDCEKLKSSSKYRELKKRGINFFEVYVDNANVDKIDTALPTTNIDLRFEDRLILTLNCEEKNVYSKILKSLI